MCLLELFWKFEFWEQIYNFGIYAVTVITQKIFSMHNYGRINPCK